MDFCSRHCTGAKVKTNWFENDNFSSLAEIKEVVDRFLFCYITLHYTISIVCFLFVFIFYCDLIVQHFGQREWFLNVLYK